MSNPDPTVATPEAQALYIPRLLRAAEIVFSDGRVLRGRVFVPASAAAHAGPMRVDEWLEDPAPFFPFLPDGEGRPVLVNKRQLLMVTVAASADHDLDGESGGPTRSVVVECGSLRLQGEVVVDTPPGHQRLLDLLNREGRFLLLRSGDRHHFLRKSGIQRLTEPGSAGA
jgi:hypothetical protein